MVNNKIALLGAVEKLKLIAICCICVLFLLKISSYAILSVEKPTQADSSFLFYEAWLINEKGVLPYRDIQETSFPGTYLFYTAITSLYGYSDLGFRAIDISLLIILMLVSWRIFSQFGNALAILSCLYFANRYISIPEDVLQRDYVLVLPLAMATWLILSERISENCRSVLVGFFIGLASTIKPQAALCFPAMCWLLVSEKKDRLAAVLAKVMLGLAMPWVICVAWLYCNDGLGNFIGMATQYLPLYLQLDSANNEFQWPIPSVETIAACVLLPFPDYLVGLAGAAWAYTQTRDKKIKKLVIYFIVMATLYKIYVIVGMKMWSYHWIPFVYFLTPCLCLCFKEQDKNNKNSVVLSLVMMAAFFLLPSNSMGYLFRNLGGDVKDAVVFLLDGNNERPSRKQSEKDALIVFLQAIVKPGETVQPMVATTYGPVLPALLQLRLAPASPKYPLAIMAYHHVQADYIKKVRRDYISELAESRPDFIVDDGSVQLLVKDNAINAFPEFDSFLLKNYRKIKISPEVKKEIGVSDIYILGKDGAAAE